MLDHRHLRAVEEIDKLHDKLRPALPDHMKRRDPAEPGRTVKEAYEDRIEALMLKYFNGQKKRLKQFYKDAFPERKAAKALLPPDDLLSDPKIEAELLLLMNNMAQHALELFMADMTIGFDVGRYAVKVLEIARQAVAQLVSGANETTKEAIRQAVTAMVETPGMTIGQLADMLPFNEIRSRMIAITETTNLYAGVQLEMGNMMAADYPDVPVVKTWFTNNDDRVCDICGPFHMQRVGLNEYFVHPELGLEFQSPSAHPNCRCWMTTRTVIEEFFNE